MRISALWAAAVWCLIGFALSSCASYTPKPLGEHPALRPSVRELAVSADEFPLPERGTHTFDPQRPLDIDDVAMIAVANNPDLRAVRARIGVAQAQVFAAGILPNPQFSFSYAPLIGGPGTANAIVAALSQDVVPILVLSTRKAAAQAAESSIDLDVAWQEWQVVSRARILFADAVSLGKQRRLIEESLRLFKKRYAQTARAVEMGNEVIQTAIVDLVALNAAETELYTVDDLILKNKHDLNALLGLLPDAALRLSGRVRLPPIDAARIQPLLMDLAARRPDLLALRASYQAEEEKVWQTVIEQFPKLSVSPSYSTDTTAVRSLPMAISISLPIFDRNQGNIAIEFANREQLWEEYRARLAAAYGQAKRLVTELQLIETQYRSSGESVRRLRDAVATAEPAFLAGNLDERSFLDLRTSLLAKEIATARLEQSIWEQRIGLQTLIGSNLPNRRPDLGRTL